MAEALRTVDVIRVRGGVRAAESDRAATEEPLEIRLHDQPFAVIMRTPGADRELGELLERNEAEGPIFKMRDDPRRTRLGALMRRWSIDELPQLWNVGTGEMSLVGPRPATPREVALYEDWQLHRLDTLPGITGLWQVSGRSELGFSEQVLMDIMYIENWSLGLDLRILLRTIPAVLSGKGAF